METVTRNPTEGIYPAVGRAYADANAEARVRELGGRLVPTTAIVVETLESDWLVEIEIVAAG